MPSPAAADRNLLFGILALQMDFVSRDALIAAMHAWVLYTAQTLGQLTVQQVKHGASFLRHYSCAGSRRR